MDHFQTRLVQYVDPKLIAITTQFWLEPHHLSLQPCNETSIFQTKNPKHHKDSTTNVGLSRSPNTAHKPILLVNGHVSQEPFKQLQLQSPLLW